MIKHISFLLLLLALVSCHRQSPKVICYYADGTAIADQTHLRLLNRELPGFAKKQGIKQRDLRVYTSLQSGINEELRQEAIQLQDAVYPQIHWKHSEAKARMDSLRMLGQMLDISIVVIDNTTGQIIVQYANCDGKWGDGSTLKRDIGSLNRTFLYTLAMADHEPFERYPQTKGFFNNTPDPTVNRSFYDVFAGRTGQNFPHGLESRYSIEMANAYARHLQLHSKRFEPGMFLFDLNVSMTSLTKTWAAFYNDGMLREPTVIDSITDSNGKLLYKHKPVTKRILREKTAKRMMSLLDYYTNTGFESRGFRHQYPDVPDYIGNFGRIVSRNSSGIFMAIHQNYTIGVCCYYNRRDAEMRNYKWRQIPATTFPIWTKAVEQLTKHHRPPGKMQHEFQPPKPEPEVTIDL